MAESGTHDALMSVSGLCAAMVDRQSGFSVGADGEIAVSPDHLRRIPLLSELSADHLETLSEAFGTVRIDPGTAMVREGERADAFLIVYHD